MLPGCLDFLFLEWVNESHKACVSRNLDWWQRKTPSLTLKKKKWLLSPPSLVRDSHFSKAVHTLHHWERRHGHWRIFVVQRTLDTIFVPFACHRSFILYSYTVALSIAKQFHPSSLNTMIFSKRKICIQVSSIYLLRNVVIALAYLRKITMFLKSEEEACKQFISKTPTDLSWHSQHIAM